MRQKSLDAELSIPTGDEERITRAENSHNVRRGSLIVEAGSLIGRAESLAPRDGKPSLKKAAPSLKQKVSRVEFD